MAKKNAVLDELRAFMQLCIDAESQNRTAALEDIRFSGGEADQWPSAIKTQRMLDRRPCLTIDKTDTFVRSVVNNMRQQRPRIKVHPVSDGADQATAEVRQGLIRHIEVSSNADAAYDTGADYQVRMGWGYWRVLSRYSDEKSWDQDLFIQRIRNPFTVYFDPSSIEPDGLDATRVAITGKMRRPEFEAKYQKAKFSSWTLTGPGDDVPTRDEITLVEFLRFEDTPMELLRLSNGDSVWADEHREQDGGPIVIDRRHSIKRQLKWSLCSGSEELDKRDLPGHYTGVIPCYGAEKIDNGKVVRFGMVRALKDPQRMYNFWRPLALDTPIPTPAGWKRMGEVHAGDLVFDEFGQPCEVIGESPIHINRKCYRVTFDDGSSVVSDGEHPWTVEERGSRSAKTWHWSKKDVTTSEMVPGDHFIAVAKPLQLPDAELPIDPYLLGVWLGDGATAEPRITQSTQDVEELRARLASRGLTPGPATSYASRLGKHGAACFSVYGVRKHFVRLGLLGNKHIPAAYLRASESQRWELLQGLMDTDGSISKSGLCSFTNTNPAIAEGFSELLRSLGIKVKFVKRVGRVRMWADGTQSAHADAWQFHFSAHDDQPVFGLSRKAERLPSADIRQDRRTKRHGIVSVTEVGSVPVKCIAVNTPTHLFLAGPGMVPTHNSAETEFVALAPKAPWLMADGQDEGHEDEWNLANVKNFSSLKYKPVTDDNGNVLPPPMRQPPQQIPAAHVNAAMQASEDLKAVAGMFDPALGAPGQETSGVMVGKRQQQSDLSNFHFYDNLTRSIRATGIVIDDLIPHYYDTPRAIRILGDDGVPQSVTINEQAVGKVMNDMTGGRFDVVMDTGPGFDTKRLEARDAMLELVRSFPQIAQIGGDLILRQFDAPGMEALADRVAAMIPAAQIDKQLPKDIDPDVRKYIAGVMAQLHQAQQMVQQLQQEKAAKLFGIEQKEHAVTVREMHKEDAESQRQAQREAAETARLHLKEGAQTHRELLRLHADQQMNTQDNATSMHETGMTVAANLELGHMRAQQHGVPNANRPTNQQ